MKNKTQKNCDDLLSPIIRKIYTKCLLCNNLPEVAHHHCHKSKSGLLRYDMENLIPLCNSCHLKLHWNESFWASKVVQIKGLEWFKYIEKQTHNPDIKNYKPNYNKIYDELSTILEA